MNCKRNLNGNWMLFYTDPGAGEKQKAFLPAFSPPEKIMARVPGMVQTDMLAAGKIPDPFPGKNTDQIRWMENRDWWYRREFSYRKRPGVKKITLIFHGLDTFATVWLNGIKIGSHDNFFTAVKFDASRAIRDGGNTLTVKLGSIWTFAEKHDLLGLGIFNMPGRMERILIRKPAMSFGWDIAPRIVTFGIWRPVELRESGGADIEDVRVVTKRLKAADFLVRVEINLRNNTGRPWNGNLNVTAVCGKSRFSRSVSAKMMKRSGKIVLSMPLKNAKTWWPIKTGPQNLYRLKINLRHSDKTVDAYSGFFGCREIKLIQEPQENGRAHSFIFEVNGKRIYIKGTNWIPVDAIFSRVTRGKYDRVLDLACRQGNNMFRLWGGGIYEDPYFYEQCDRLGILVWQDFMFACAVYPQEKWFLKQVQREAEFVVKSLRNHPCMALWCGDNEIERGWYGGSKAKGQPLDEYKSYVINRKLLPSVCRKFDPDRPYLTSSPTSPFGAVSPDDPYEGDHHLWAFSRHYKDPVYAGDKCRFVSEIGSVSLPMPASLRRFIPENCLWPIDPDMYAHHTGNACGQKTEENPYMQERKQKAAVFSALRFPIQCQVAQPFKIIGGFLKISRRPSGATALYRFEVPDPFIVFEKISAPSEKDVLDFETALKEGRAAHWLLPDSDQPLRASLQPERFTKSGRLWQQQLFDVFVEKDNRVRAVRIAWYGEPCFRDMMEEGVSSQGLPIARVETLEKYALYSQVAQAIAMQAWMEHYRRRKWLCGGSLYWNLYDNWPEISTGMVDYYGVPKISYYSIKRSYAELLVSFQEEAGKILVKVVNDLPDPVRGTLIVRLETWAGVEVWRKEAIIDIPANHPPVTVCEIKPDEVPARPDAFLRAQVVCEKTIRSENFHFFGEPALINPPECRLSCRIRRGPDYAEAALTADSFARYVYLSLPDMEEYIFSDNWFHLLAGETKQILIRRHDGRKVPGKITVAALNCGIRG